MDSVLSFKTNNLTEAEGGLPRHPVRILFGLYLLSVLLRFLLSYYLRHMPSIYVDESLYINIAKSLAAGEGIAYRSQPVLYPYIFYPLLLVPLHLFPTPFDLYRIIQLYNVVLISSSAFPAYLFARDFTGDKRKALLAASFTLLMPDLQIAGLLMAESVIWPLSLWLIFFSCRLFLSEEKRLFNGVMVGFFSALLFWTKPGAIAMGIILLLSALFLGEKPQIQKRRPAVLAGFAVCGVLIVFFYVLYVFVFHYSMSLLGLYRKQLTVVTAAWVAAVIEFSLLQLLLFAIACGGVFFVLPLVSYVGYDEDRKQFISAFLIGLVVTAVGTAALVDMFQWNGSYTNPQLHLRYMAMFVPVMFVFSLGASFPQQTKKRSLLLALGGMAVLVVFPGASVGFVKGESTYMDSFALSAYLSDFIPPTVGIILTAALVLFLAWLCLQIARDQTSSLKKHSLVFFALFLFYNNTCGYIACTYPKDENGCGSDAVQMNAVLEELPGDVLIVTQQLYNETLSYCLESRLRKPYQQVTIDALIEALAETDGVYRPFIPEDQSPNVGNHLTPETNTFLFGATVADHVEFSPSAQVQKSANDWYALVKVPEGERMADTMLYGIDLQTLHENQQSKLYVFDDSLYRKGKLSFTLLAYSNEPSVSLVIENTNRQMTFPLSENPQMINLSLRPGETVITAVGGDAMIPTYSTK